MKKNFLQITLFLISVAFFAQEKNEEKKDDNKSKSISELQFIKIQSMEKLKWQFLNLN